MFWTFAVVIIFIMAVAIFLLRKVKLKFILISALVFLTLILLLFIGSGMRKYLQKSIPLSNENIENIRIGEKINEKEVDKDLEQGSEWLTLKRNVDVSLVLDEKQKVTQIQTNLNLQHSAVKTSKGICLGDSIEEVIKKYGSSYLKIMYSDFYERGIFYRDKENHIQLTFYFTNNKVMNINLKKY